jgi:hypothetical protein
MKRWLTLGDVGGHLRMSATVWGVDDFIRGPQVDPVLGWVVVERQQHLLTGRSSPKS